MGRNYKNNKKKPSEFDQKLVDLARVTRVMAGGRRFRFRAAVVIGNKKGKVGLGVAKGPDVAIAVDKAVSQARKNLIFVPISDGTIPYITEVKFKAARVLLKPAREGTGIIAGGPVRAVIEAVGIKDILSKSLGSSNKISNVKATLIALKNLETREEIKKRKST